MMALRLSRMEFMLAHALQVEVDVVGVAPRGDGGDQGLGEGLMPDLMFFDELVEGCC